ncbi:unnamed protein product [Acanthosepion pharaonis]|uniref:Uncharacterized protein n=1 Tax=Acanthosepion pharaonis TaxID=158019 RepID=A0A812DE59_ACAPH|nr:unnamed protein product [Sepia pharaonis]
MIFTLFPLYVILFFSAYIMTMGMIGMIFSSTVSFLFSVFYRDLLSHTLFYGSLSSDILDDIPSSLFYISFLCLLLMMTGYRDDVSTSSLFYAMSLFSAYIMTGYRDDINFSLPSSILCLFLSYILLTGYRDDIKHTPSLFYAMSLFSAYIMTGYRDDILPLSSLFYAMSLFSVYIMTGYRDDIPLFPLFYGIHVSFLCFSFL